jgi:acyl-CoA-binding protein
LEKQAIEGDNESKKDLSHLHGREEDKHEAWEKFRGKRQKEAQAEYVTLVKTILKKHHADHMIQEF